MTFERSGAPGRPKALRRKDLDGLRGAIGESGLSRTQISRDAGIRRGVLNSWLEAEAAPEPDDLHALADGLKRRSAEIGRLADRVRQLAGERRAKQRGAAPSPSGPAPLPRNINRW